MIALSFLVLLFAWDGRIGRLDGLLLSGGLVAYTMLAIVQSRKEQADIQAEYAAEFGQSAAVPKRLSTIWNLFLLAAGLVLLVLGSRWFVEAAVTLARTLGVSELVIGLTIVAAGTSLPEVATSIMAAMRGERDIAVGNVVGSNLFNLMGVLGISSLVSPVGVSVSAAALALDIPVMIAVAVACLPIFFTGHMIARWEGGLFLAFYLAYTTYIVLAATDSELTRTFGTVMLAIVIPLILLTLAVGVMRQVLK
jgi:cation:H+ antiporter